MVCFALPARVSPYPPAECPSTALHRSKFQMSMIQLLRNIVNLQGIESSLEFVVMGGVILVAVSLDQVLAARRRAREARIDVKAPQAEPARPKARPDRRVDLDSER
jgi:hypothetical protein